MKKVGIIDYGTGNIASVAAAVARAGGKALLVSDPLELGKVDTLVLPGVGHFTRAVGHLRACGMQSMLRKLAAQRDCPIMGICLGMQLLGLSSEESTDEEGLSVLPLCTHRIRPASPSTIKVPHMGWNTVTISAGEPRLLRGIDLKHEEFYFANAYAVHAEPDTEILEHCATYEHGGLHLAVVEKDILFGVQFHPEKSREAGVEIFRNFLSI